jgi:hypothetical protein
MKDRSDQDFIININSFDNFNFSRPMRKHVLKQCKFALKPKLSGNIDLRLNRINLRKIEKGIREIKFIDNLKLVDQIDKVKHHFMKNSITIMDDQMINEYMQIRHSLFPQQPTPQ